MYELVTPDSSISCDINIIMLKKTVIPDATLQLFLTTQEKVMTQDWVICHCMNYVTKKFQRQVIVLTILYYPIYTCPYTQCKWEDLFYQIITLMNMISF